MVERKIIWIKNAEKELKDILDFYLIKTYSSTYPEYLLDKVKDVIDKIKTFPKIGKKTNSDNIRVCTFDNFQIFYKLKNDTVYIISFWDSRRNPKDRIY